MTLPIIDLILFNEDVRAQESCKWTLGTVREIEATPTALFSYLVDYLRDVSSEYVLFWDKSIPLPHVRVLERIISLPGDVWHAGLKLGTGGKPGLIDFIHPTWMLNRDPDPGIDATSWRISLRACVMRTEVLHQFGGIQENFETLDAAGLELGHRLIQGGVFVRHFPNLVGSSELLDKKISRVSFEDEIRFILSRFGPAWCRWGILRALLSKSLPLRVALKAWSGIGSEHCVPCRVQFKRTASPAVDIDASSRVSVLIPTLDRYEYLRAVLDQLRPQTIEPYEIVIVDQTHITKRITGYYNEFDDLPLKVIYLDQPGQCSSRNAGIRDATGEYLLFLDDDDEIQPTLIEDHLKSLKYYSAAVSSGVAIEDQAGALPYDFTFTRISDVFPTNNSFIKKTVLNSSGLFDLAYDKGQRADRDLGIRIYLSGALMVLNSDISVIHHHAPTGGLREHKARVITYASSRRRLFKRHLPTVSEVYLAKRYYTDVQVREMLWLRVFGTFACHGTPVRKVMKIFVSALLFPHTLYVSVIRCRTADEQLGKYPIIPMLSDI